jgi:SAM-dependent methyltransferase
VSFPPGFFDRFDPAPDPAFYAAPRFVTHIDDGAIAAIGALYAELGLDRGRVLDLMSSWISHFDVPPDELVGLGMNAEELRANPALHDHVVQDLNADPALPFADDAFDHAVCAVSVDYLTRPLEVFAEVARVLRPGGVFACTFSNPLLPDEGHPRLDGHRRRGHVAIVRRYFELTPGFSAPSSDLRTPAQAAGDPLWAVWRRRAEPAGALTRAARQRPRAASTRRDSRRASAVPRAVLTCTV